MKSTGCKLLTWSLLAIYGGISLLGHGLHWLAPDDGHHHGLYVVRCAEHAWPHGHEHAHHAGHHHHHHHHHHPDVRERAGDRQDTGRQVVRSNECGTHSHLCAICEFLSQSRGERVQLAAAVDWQPVVVAASCLPQRSYTPTSVGIHAPRGPPAEQA